MSRVGGSSQKSTELCTDKMGWWCGKCCDWDVKGALSRRMSRLLTLEKISSAEPGCRGWGWVEGLGEKSQGWGGKKEAKVKRLGERWEKPTEIWRKDLRSKWWSEPLSWNHSSQSNVQWDCREGHLPSSGSDQIECEHTGIDFASWRLASIHSWWELCHTHPQDMSLSSTKWFLHPKAHVHCLLQCLLHSSSISFLSLCELQNQQWSFSFLMEIYALGTKLEKCKLFWKAPLSWPSPKHLVPFPEASTVPDF